VGCSAIINSEMNKVAKVRLHQRYFDFKRDLKSSLPRFNVEKETERVLSFA